MIAMGGPNLLILYDAENGRKMATYNAEMEIVVGLAWSFDGVSITKTTDNGSIVIWVVNKLINDDCSIGGEDG